MSSHRKEAKHDHKRTEQDENLAAPEEQAAEAAADETELLKEDIRKLADERDEAKAQVLRVLAELQNNQRDFQNYRKRTQQEMASFRQLATEQLVADLLPVLDNFERTVSHLDAGATIESVVNGVTAVERQLKSILEAQGVRRIASVGSAFDPELHEALGSEPSDVHPDDTVVTEIEPGYKMGERVIRPARVKVAKNP